MREVTIAYEFRPHSYGALISKRIGSSAQAVGSRLEWLREQKRSLTPQTVVEDAKALDSPLHEFFDWDDAVAAKKQRLNQARSLMASVVTVSSETNNAPVRAFINVIVKSENNKTESREYVPANVVLSGGNTRDQMLKKAIQELTRWQEKYLVLSELAPIFEVIEEIKKKNIMSILGHGKP